MRQAHAHLIDQGLNDSHFDAVKYHLETTLSELGVEEGLINEVLTITESTRNDVLNK